MLWQEQTIEELKEEISANYTSFIQATTEIKRMENSVSQLKTLVLDCKRSIQCLKSVSLDISAGTFSSVVCWEYSRLCTCCNSSHS